MDAFDLFLCLCSLYRKDAQVVEMVLPLQFLRSKAGQREVGILQEGYLCHPGDARFTVSE